MSLIKYNLFFFGGTESTKLNSIRKGLDGKVRNFSPTKISSFTVSHCPCFAHLYVYSLVEEKLKGMRKGVKGNEKAKEKGKGSKALAKQKISQMSRESSL